MSTYVYLTLYGILILRVKIASLVTVCNLNVLEPQFFVVWYDIRTGYIYIIKYATQLCKSILWLEKAYISVLKKTSIFHQSFINEHDYQALVKHRDWNTVVSFHIHYFSQYCIPSDQLVNVFILFYDILTKRPRIFPKVRSAVSQCACTLIQELENLWLPRSAGALIRSFYFEHTQWPWTLQGVS